MNDKFVHMVIKVLLEPPNNLAMCTVDSSDGAKLYLPDGPQATQDQARVTCPGCLKYFKDLLTLKMNMRSRVR